LLKSKFLVFFGVQVLKLYSCSIGIVGVHPEEVLETSQKAVHDGRLYRCLMCDAISELTIDPDWLHKDGVLYILASTKHGSLQSNKMYQFPSHGKVLCFLHK
jgi:deubiquitinating protein VCIP135